MSRRTVSWSQLDRFDKLEAQREAVEQLCSSIALICAAERNASRALAAVVSLVHSKRARLESELDEMTAEGRAEEGAHHG